jgi:hypothetical protein
MGSVNPLATASKVISSIQQQSKLILNLSLLKWG